MIHSIYFKNQKGQKLRGFIHEPKKFDTAIIVLHGFPGTCTGKRVTGTCKKLEKKGYLAMRFDFSGTNISDGKFENKLMSQEVKELKYAIDFLKKNYKFNKLVLHGHSTGAIDAALYAYKDKRINKLILTGATDDLKKSARFDFTDEMVHDFWTKGYVTYKTPGYWTTGKKLRKAFYDEFFTLSIPKAIKKFKRPLLIIHGNKDDAVPIERAKSLFLMANKPKKLVILKNCDHKFSQRGKLDEFIKIIIKFIER